MEEARGVPWGWGGCSLRMTSPVTSSFCAVSILCATKTQPRRERKGLLISYSRHVKCVHPSSQGLDDEESFQAGQVDRALSGVPGAAHEGSPVFLRPAWPGWLQSKSLFIFAELVRWVPVRNKAHSPANLITSNKNLHSWDPEIWLTAAKPKERNKEWGSNYFLPTLCLINPLSSLAAQFIFDDCPRRQLQKSNT